jgi:hypothetical protein
MDRIKIEKVEEFFHHLYLEKSVLYNQNNF